MFFRYKNPIGDELRARNEDSRRVESIIACNILNRLKLLGSPQSELIRCIFIYATKPQIHKAANP